MGGGRGPGMGGGRGPGMGGGGARGHGMGGGRGPDMGGALIIRGHRAIGPGCSIGDRRQTQVHMHRILFL